MSKNTTKTRDMSKNTTSQTATAAPQQAFAAPQTEAITINLREATEAYQPPSPPAEQPIHMIMEATISVNVPMGRKDEYLRRRKALIVAGTPPELATSLAVDAVNQQAHRDKVAPEMEAKRQRDIEADLANAKAMVKKLNIEKANIEREAVAAGEA